MVTFTGNCNPLENGAKAKIYLFLSGDNPNISQPFPDSPIEAISDSYGNLTSEGKNYFLIPKGCYDFYSISRRKSDILDLNIEKGVSSPLENDIDYLWSGDKSREVSVNSIIHLNFYHSSSKIVLDFCLDDNTKEFKIEEAIIFPSENGGKMSLATGEISKANKICDIGYSMRLIGQSAEFIMLPLESNIRVPVEIVLSLKDISGNSIVRNLKGTISSPEGGFTGGFAYHFKAKIHNESVSFSNLIVMDWYYAAPIEIKIIEQE